MPKVSIIVPIYKAEAMLQKCLDSIRRQSESDWECLLLDDGSPDRSGAICDAYAARDSRFITLHKPNGGVSETRNMGLDMAKGDWIMFIDADDSIAPETLEIALYNANVNNLDIIQFSFTRDKSQIGLHDDSATGVCLRDEYIAKNKMLGAVWGSLVKASIIRDNNIRFDRQMKLAEDQLFTYTCMSYANRMQRLPNMLYYYYDNPGSATNNEKTEDIIYSSQQCIKFKESHPVFSFRIDDLVLFYIEKLLLKKEYKISVKLLTNLNPASYTNRPWIVRLACIFGLHNMVSMYFCSLCLRFYNELSAIKSKAKKHE